MSKDETSMQQLTLAEIEAQQKALAGEIARRQEEDIKERVKKAKEAIRAAGLNPDEFSITIVKKRGRPPKSANGDARPRSVQAAPQK